MNLFKKIILFISDYLILFLLIGIIALGGLFYLTAPTENLPLRTYLIGYDETWYPLNLLDKEDYIYSFSDDILQAIAKEQHLSFQLVSVKGGELFS